MRTILMVMALVGCGGVGGDVQPDGAPSDERANLLCETYGEACVSDPYPVNTVCHHSGGGDGWCIDNVCRPMCSSETQMCAALERRVAPAGAGYCAPR